MVDMVGQRYHPVLYVFGYYVLFVSLTSFGIFCTYCVLKYRQNCRESIPPAERYFCSTAGTEISAEKDGVPMDGGNLFPDLKGKGAQVGYYGLNRYPDIRHIMAMLEKSHDRRGGVGLDRNI